MKDYCLDYGSRGRRRRRLIRNILLITAAAAAVGIIGFFTVRYYMRIMAEQRDSSGELTPTAADLTCGDSDVYGLWHGGPDDTSDEHATAEDDYYVWMKDFKDTRQWREVKGLYVSSDALGYRLDSLVETALASEINALVIDIKDDRGRVICEVESPTADRAGAVKPLVEDMPSIISRLKEQGIYTIARISAFRDPIAAAKLRDIGFRNSDGTVYYDSSSRPWLNPYTEGAWEYMAELGRACAAIGFDEVNYDYMCFCRESSLKSTNITEAPEGLSRSDVITDGMRRLCEQLKPLGIFVSCNVYGVAINGGIDASALGQDYFKLAGYVDYICPIVFPSQYGRGYMGLDIPDNHPYELVKGLLDASMKSLYMLDPDGNRAEVRPWLQDYTAGAVTGHIEYGSTEVRAEIDATYDAGYFEWTLWNTSGFYSTDALMEAN